jgi:hypothetical protein
MQTVITIEFDRRVCRIQAATPQDAIAYLRNEYAEDERECDVDLNTLSTQCVTARPTVRNGRLCMPNRANTSGRSPRTTSGI